MRMRWRPRVEGLLRESVKKVKGTKIILADGNPDETWSSACGPIRVHLYGARIRGILFPYFFNSSLARALALCNVL